MINLGSEFKAIEGSSGRFYLALAGAAALAALTPLSALYMFLEGHHVTGMSNQVPWGLPIVVAIYLIGASAGSLVMSAMSSVFGKTEFKPFARIAAVLSILLITAALMAIILDWGRPDRIMVPFFHIQPRSMFSLNAFLYTAYIVLGFVYLWAIFERKRVFERNLGLLAVVLAVLVHSGTGAIFGFVYVRELYGSPLLSPSFVAAALSSGTALMIVILYLTFKISGRHLDEELLHKLGSLMGVFILVVIYLLFIENVTRVYAPNNYELARFMLLEKNQISFLFWFVFVSAGLLLPALTTLQKATSGSTFFTLLAASAHLGGVLVERYLIVIPAQVTPLELLPGKEISSLFNDGVYTTYWPSLAEIGYSVGLIGVVTFGYMVALKLFPIAPIEARKLELIEEAASMVEERALEDMEIETEIGSAAR